MTLKKKEGKRDKDRKTLEPHLETHVLRLMTRVLTV